MEIEYTPEADADLSAIPPRFRSQLLRKIDRLRHGMHGDIKQVHADEVVYRLRSGDYRALFAVEENTVVVLKIKHRREAYD